MPFKTKEELEKMREDLYSLVWPMISDVENKTWTQKGGTDRETGLVFKGYHEKIGTVWKLEVILDMTPKQYFETILMKPEMMDWVPSLADYKVVERSPDRDWEVTYSYASRLGPISARDFVNMNFYKNLDDGSGLGILGATDHPDTPLQQNVVRGEYLPSATLIVPLKDDPKRSCFYWVNNVDMKGFLPRALINLAMKTVMLDLAAALVGKAKKVAAAQ